MAHHGPPSLYHQYPPMLGEDRHIRVQAGEGVSAKTFEVHKRLLIFYSGYFAGALRGSFTESNNGLVELPTEEPDVVNLAIYWMYTRRFQPDTRDQIRSMTFDLLCQLWVFGDAHEIPMLQNAAIDLLHKKVVEEWQAPIKQIRYVYDNTPIGAKLRQLVIDMIGKTCNADMVLKREREKWWCKEAMADLLRLAWNGQYLAQISKMELESWNMCRYHVHKEGESCRVRSDVQIK